MKGKFECCKWEGRLFSGGCAGVGLCKIVGCGRGYIVFYSRGCKMSML